MSQKKTKKNSLLLPFLWHIENAQWTFCTISDENNPLSQTIPDAPTELKFFIKLCEQRRKFPVLYKIEFTVSFYHPLCRHIHFAKAEKWMRCDFQYWCRLTLFFFLIPDISRLPSPWMTNIHHDYRLLLKQTHVDMQRKRITWKRIKIRKRFHTTTIAWFWRRFMEY